MAWQPAHQLKQWLLAGRKRRIVLGLFLGITAGGFLVPERLRIPVQGAGTRDWNHQTFWYSPWGASGVHKGIDIFAPKGRRVISAVDGLVISKQYGGLGGRTVVVLGPKWRLHYYAHMDTVSVSRGQWLHAGEPLGTVGTTGNALGKPPHLHYTIFSTIPYPWRLRFGTQGWKKMFYLNPHQMLVRL